MSTVRCVCPHYKSGVCRESGCDGYMPQVFVAGYDNDSCEQLYTGFCTRNGIEHFANLRAENVPPPEKQGVVEVGVNAEANLHKVRPRRSKRGVGGKGPKTEFMKKQLKSFGRFLVNMRYKGDESRLYALATQCWNTNKAKWDKAKIAEGQNKGYSSSKVLADAYKKSIL